MADYIVHYITELGILPLEQIPKKGPDMDQIKKDLVIIGGGPAGLSAAIYAQRALLDNVVLEQEAVGGQVILTSEVDNYPGVPHTDGYSLVEAMQSQVKDLGGTIQMEVVRSVEKNGDDFIVTTSEHEYVAKAVIVSGGATPRHAGFAGEKEFGGRGVSYCATCDGMFYRGKRVFVIGGGNSAAEEALFLTKFADKVTMVVRKDHMRAQAAVQSQVDKSDKIDVMFNSKVVSVSGDGLLESITFENTVTGEQTTQEFDKGSFGVFVFVGCVPASELVRDLVERDSSGYVITDDHMATATPGLYAAGDIRQKALRQIVTAASDGAIAATSVAGFLGQPVEG